MIKSFYLLCLSVSQPDQFIRFVAEVWEYKKKAKLSSLSKAFAAFGRTDRVYHRFKYLHFLHVTNKESYNQVCERFMSYLTFSKCNIIAL